jgi:hypothetical protein
VIFKEALGVALRSQAVAHTRVITSLLVVRSRTLVVGLVITRAITTKLVVVSRRVMITDCIW